jgi:hypothetical protein
VALRRHLRRGSTVLLVAGVLLVGGGTAVLLWPRPRVVAEVGSVFSAPPSTPAPTSGSAPSSAPPTTAPAPAGFVPKRLVVGSQAIDARLTPTVVDGDGALVPPDDPARLAWWRGVRPGEGAGSVLVAGHLDVVGYDVGPLARIVDLREGDHAVLEGSHGARAEYVLRGVTTIPKEELPDADLFGTGGPERLVLVTCGGTFDPDVRGWDSNVVAVLDPVPAG